MAANHEIEEGTEVRLDFEKLSRVAKTGHPVIPAAVQDVDSKAVLLIGYVNKQALEHALEHRVATFWSTSRNELWIKGATSGDMLDLIDVRVNCEQNSLLYMVRLKRRGVVPYESRRSTALRLLLPQHRQRQARIRGT